jgi:hypothetical protein
MIYLCRDGKIFERYYRSSLKDAPSKLVSKLRKDIVRILDKVEQNILEN